MSTENISADGVRPSTDREWLVTNGLGGYASLTLLNTNSRKFHGLLVASLSPPLRRWVFLSNLEESVEIDGENFLLKDHLKSFRPWPLPEFFYELDGVILRKKIWMVYGKNITILRYEIGSDADIRFRFVPLLSSRHFYDVVAERSIEFFAEENDGCLTFEANNQEIPVRVMLDYQRYNPINEWTTLFFDVDRERGEECHAGSLRVGEIISKREAGRPLHVVLTAEEGDCDPVEEFENELRRRKQILRTAKLSEEFAPLVMATDSFIARRNGFNTILAGYHWFGDWGRDALISLPGIALVTRRYEIAKDILLILCGHKKDGLIPNAFLDRTDEAIYNSVDAPLWMIDRVYQYVKYSSDLSFVGSIWNDLKSVIDNYIQGTRFDIKMDEDYLISHSGGLTWMDVNINGSFITPRERKAVEVQALWYNALRIMQSLAHHCRKENGYGNIADKVRKSFQDRYDAQYDVLDAGDLSCRPNKIFLVSLDYSPVKMEIQKSIVSDIQDRLLTPYGLRSLSKDSPGYLGRLIGDYNKDLAYHNGTIWPWLLGPFVRAFLKTKHHEKEWREHALEHFIVPILRSMNEEGGIGYIGEIFDGDEPHIPRGCISQAWSLAEILRTLVEDIYYMRPPHEKQFLLEDYIHDIY